jgi:hypothetical protein
VGEGEGGALLADLRGFTAQIEEPVGAITPGEDDLVLARDLPAAVPKIGLGVLFGGAGELGEEVGEGGVALLAGEGVAARLEDRVAELVGAELELLPAVVGWVGAQ